MTGGEPRSAHGRAMPAARLSGDHDKGEGALCNTAPSPRKTLPGRGQS